MKEEDKLLKDIERLESRIDSVQEDYMPSKKKQRYLISLNAAVADRYETLAHRMTKTGSKKSNDYLQCAAEAYMFAANASRLAGENVKAVEYAAQTRLLTGTDFIGENAKEFKKWQKAAEREANHGGMLGLLKKIHAAHLIAGVLLTLLFMTTKVEYTGNVTGYVAKGIDFLGIIVFGLVIAGMTLVIKRKLKN